MKAYRALARWIGPEGGVSTAERAIDARDDAAAMKKAEAWGAECGPVGDGQKVALEVRCVEVMTSEVAGKAADDPA